MEPENLTPEELNKLGKLEEINAWMSKELDKARDAETQAINEFEKSLWLANSGAATVTIGFLTSSCNSTIIQFYGCIAFVTAIIFLLLMRLVSEINSSRDRNRRQDHSDKFFTQNKPISFMDEIRDSWYQCLKNTYIFFKYSAAVLFVIGCGLTLSGVNPVH